MDMTSYFFGRMAGAKNSQEIQKGLEDISQMLIGLSSSGNNNPGTPGGVPTPSVPTPIEEGE